MAVHPVCLDERHRGGDRTEQLVRDRLCLGRRGGLGLDRRRRLAVARALEQAREPRMGGHDVTAPALEELTPLRRDRVRILEVLLEQVACEA
jgi:hypothetical protein